MIAMKKKVICVLVCCIVALTTVIAGASIYMLNFSLSPDPNRHDTDSIYAILYKRLPDMRQWVDSVKANHQLRDTFITMGNGRKAHALYMRNSNARGRTAIVIHGYKDTAVKFLYLGRMYHRDIGYNILMPDLYAHGLSDGEEIQMGWKDRLDIMRWTCVAEKLFRDSLEDSQIVIHGVSMGAATTMCVAGETLPKFIRCFVEDCGYTSVWDEFTQQLKEQFGLPSFPLMYSTSLLCKLRYGWDFKEASPLNQVKKSKRPILFIHGDADTFVPTWMVSPLYKAAQGQKELWIAAHSEHAKSFIDHPDEYRRKVAGFVRKHMKAKLR